MVGVEIFVGSGGVDGCCGCDDGFCVVFVFFLMVDGSDFGVVDGKFYWMGFSWIYLDLCL